MKFKKIFFFSFFLFFLSLLLSLLLCSVLQTALWPEEGDFPENLHRVVYVILIKRSFESFVYLDLILERLQSNSNSKSNSDSKNFNHPTRGNFVVVMAVNAWGVVGEGRGWGEGVCVGGGGLLQIQH